MASEINRLKARFEANNGSTSKTQSPSKPLPSPPNSAMNSKQQSTTATERSANATKSSPKHSKSSTVGTASTSSSLKIKPRPPPSPSPSTTKKSDTLPTKNTTTAPAQPSTTTGSGTPPTTKAEAKLHLSSVLSAKVNSSSPPSNRRASSSEAFRKNSVNGVAGASSSPKPIPGSPKVVSGPPIKSFTGTSTANKVIAGTSPKLPLASSPFPKKSDLGTSPKLPPASSPSPKRPDSSVTAAAVKTPLKPVTSPKRTPSAMSASSPKPAPPHKPLTPLNARDKGGVVMSSSSSSTTSSSMSSSNGTSSSTTGNVASIFGVTLSHRDTNERGTPHHHTSPAKVKPMQPPSSPFNVKLRSTSIHVTDSGGNSTNDSAADVSSRDERASSVPRDIELSGGFENQNQPSAGKKAHHQRSSPGKRPKSVDEHQISSGGIGKKSGNLLAKKKDDDRCKDNKKSRPLPPPKKPGLVNTVAADKPSPPPKPSPNITKSPSKPLPKPPIGHLKKNTDFSRARTGSTPDSSRESTPSLEADNEEQKMRSHSFNPFGGGGTRVSDGLLEETLKALDDRRGHSDTVTSNSSWVMIEGPSSATRNSAVGVPASWKAGSKDTSSAPVKKTLPKTPPRVKSPESISSSGSDSSKSPSVNALRSKFGDVSSPPTSPASPLSKTPGRGESKFSSGMEALREKFGNDPNKRDSLSLGGGGGGSRGGGALSVQVPDRGGRSNADSGFISEAPEDLTTVGQATSNENVSEVMETPSTPLSPDSQPEEQVVEEVWDEARLEKARGKRSNIARELLETEKTYVGRLKLIAEDFYGVVKQFSEKGKCSITDTEVMQIFLNIQQIHQLNQTILQSLETRIDSWSTEERLGDVICRLAPFLKLYSHYTSGFEEAMKTLTECTKKDKKFDTIVRDFERTTISTGLGVAHYMLEPIQRIPRYKLLLLDYLKYLPPDSPDRPDTEKALGMISEAADRNNDRIKELEISNEILSIQRSLSDYNGMLLQPSRVFLKKGTLQKMSRKNLTQRMFFLFSDVLLHTYPAHNGVYKFKDEMALCEMHIELPLVAMFPHSFEVHCTSRSLLLVAATEEEKNEWMEALDGAINDDIRKRRSLRRETFVMKRSQMKKFGYKAPIMVPDKSVSMCQVCSTEFTVLFRRHHCRACGKVVCSGCSQKKAYLHYLQKNERICESCYKEYLKESAAKSVDDIDGGSKNSSPKTPKRQESAPAGVLNLKAYDQAAVIAGYVMSQEGKKFNRVWYQVRQDCVLYKFRAHEDIKAYQALPLPGYEVKSDQGNCTIQLNHPSKKKELGDTFKVEDATAFINWTQMLEKVVRMEIPSPTHQLQRDNRFSQSFEDSYSTGNQSPHRTSIEASDTHSRRDSFESYSSESLNEDSPLTVEQQQQT